MRDATRKDCDAPFAAPSRRILSQQKIGVDAITITCPEEIERPEGLPAVIIVVEVSRVVIDQPAQKQLSASSIA